jgi:glycosyltransferase involved in cell wall biosynthesis
MINQRKPREAHARPLVTVVTVVRDAIATLRQTLDSVLEQDIRAFEYIVVDGCSTDGCQELLREYEPRLDMLLIEPDDGIANAMNKGLSLAQGDFVVYLHADDRFDSASSLRLALGKARQQPGADIYACCIELLKTQGCRRIRPRRWHGLLNLKPSLPHQGAICRRQALESLGGFDESFRIGMDYDLFLRARRAGLRFKNLPIVLSVMGDRGISNRRDVNTMHLRLSEEREVHRRNSNSAVLRGFYVVYWFLYPRYKSMLLYGNPFVLQIESK